MKFFKLMHAVPFVPWPIEDYKPVPGRQFQQVALVACSSMEQVFGLTQNLGEQSWVQQLWVLSDLDACRSTSVGDLIVTQEGPVFVVAPFGLEQIADEAQGL